MSRPPAGPSLARVGAARALMATEAGAHLDEALATHAPPPGPDRDLAWFLAYGVLRRRGHIDAALRAVLSQPIAALDPPVRAALRIGTMELLFGRTKPHAVVHQAVEVVRALGAGRAHGLVNAVLRRVAMPARLSEADRLDHPVWLLSRWRQRYGDEATARWCEQNALPPPLFVVARKENVTLPEASSPVSYRGQLVPNVFQVASEGAVQGWTGFGDGAWWVQDLASVMVADLVPAEGRVLDACAAPGGKSFRLVSRGADVLAVDRDAQRLAKVTEGASRLGLTLKTRAHDWTQGPLGKEAFDAVLVDAPCTGLGTIRRHPEIRWKRTEPDLYGAASLQGRILDAAAEHVRPGGTLVYAVCSPEPEEGEQVVDRFLARHPAFDRDLVLSTAPPEQGEDAHFAARLRRAG